jgi:uncharacterized protein YlzI (FlbEa/FlbD family)
MIVLTRLSGKELALNADLIERLDATPDTVVTLVNGTKYVVQENLATVVAAIRFHLAEVRALSRHLTLEGAMHHYDDLIEETGGLAARRPRLTVLPQQGADQGNAP